MFLLIGRESGIARYGCVQRQSNLRPVAEVLPAQLKPHELSVRSSGGMSVKKTLSGRAISSTAASLDANAAIASFDGEVVVKAVWLECREATWPRSLLPQSSSFVASTSWLRFEGLGIRGSLSYVGRSRKAREVRFHLVEDE
jgi:hypothetical protein